MTTFRNPCEGTDAADVATTGAPTGYDNWAAITKGASGIVKYDTSQAMHGGSSIRFAASTASDQARVRFDLPSVSTHATRCYLRLSAAPSATQSLVVMADASAVQQLQVRVTTNRYLTIQDSNGGSAVTGPQLAVDTWYRVETVTDNAAATVAMKVFAGDDTSAIGTWTVTSASSAAVVYAQFGKAGAGGTLADAWLDDVRVETGSNAWIGPSVVAAPVTYNRRIIIG